MVHCACAAVFAAVIYCACAHGYDATDPSFDHFARAVEMDEVGNTEAAVEAFDAEARFSPCSAAYNNLAVAMLELEHDSTASELAMIRQACAHFQTSLQLEPDNEEAATNLYQCSHKLPAAERPVQAMSASRRHQLQQQVTEYKFAAATRICNAGPVDSSMDVVGANGQTLPILSFLGSLLTPGDEPLEDLVECLVRAHVDPFRHIAGPPTFGRAALPLYATHSQNMRVMAALLEQYSAREIVLNATWRVQEDGRDTGMSMLHSRLAPNPVPLVKAMWY